MAPQNINELNALLQDTHANLSKKMQLIAFYIIDQPQHIALNTLAVIADDIGVFPSTLVRFAKHIGFGGFSELQELFKVQIAQSGINYRQRITDVKKITESDMSTSSESIFHDIVGRNIIATKLLSEHIEVALIENSVKALCAADEVIVCGVNRAHPVAIYFHYMLNNLGIRCRIADDTSGSTALSHWFSDKSVLIVASILYVYCEQSSVRFKIGVLSDICMGISFFSSTSSFTEMSTFLDLLATLFIFFFINNLCIISFL